MYTWTHEWTPKVSISLDYDHYTDRRDYLAYKLISNERIIFEGNEFSRAPLTRDCLSEKSVMHLLGFLTLKKGDTDPEHFEDYTQVQFDWIESDEAEELRLIVCDYEMERDND